MLGEIRYGVTFGKCDSSDWIDWEIDLTDEEEEAFKKAARMGEDPNTVPELQDALQRAYDDIECEEISMGIDNEDEYVLECQGLIEMDPDELNDLVANRDPKALAFFGLTDASDEELEEWDANDLDELPKLCDFDPDFEPESPYDHGWDLSVEFVEPTEEEIVEYWLEYLSEEEKYSGCVFEVSGVYFIICGESILEISTDTCESPKGSYLSVFSGPTKEEEACLRQMMEELGFEEDFFEEMMEDYGEFCDEDALSYFEENEDEESAKIYRKIKKRVESGKTPFKHIDDFVGALLRIDLEPGCLYYEWEGEFIDLRDNISEVGAERGEYENLSDDEWIEVFKNLDDYIVRR